MINQPRLLADYAATPTRTERAGARRVNRAAQLGMFDPIDRDHLADDPTPTPCAACAGDHETDRCPHGTALAMEMQP